MTGGKPDRVVQDDENLTRIMEESPGNQRSRGGKVGAEM